MNSFASRLLQHVYLRLPRQLGLARLFVISLNIALCFQITAIQSSARSTWTESSFEDFQDGTFLDSRSNLYISAKGRLQIVSRWDLNQDGFADWVVPSGHALAEPIPIAIIAPRKTPVRPSRLGGAQHRFTHGICLVQSPATERVPQPGRLESYRNAPRHRLEPRKGSQSSAENVLVL